MEDWTSDRTTKYRRDFFPGELYERLYHRCEHEYTALAFLVSMKVQLLLSSFLA